MEQTVAVFEKNVIEDVRIWLDEYRGHDLVSVRIYANYDSSRELNLPTRKSVALDVPNLAELIPALKEAEQWTCAAGMLSTDEEAA